MFVVTTMFESIIQLKFSEVKFAIEIGNNTRSQVIKE